jgi:hypothetical protein
MRRNDAPKHCRLAQLARQLEAKDESDKPLPFMRGY